MSQAELINRDQLQSELIAKLSLCLLLLEQDIKEMLPIVQANSTWDESKTKKEQDELKARVIELQQILYPAKKGKLKGTAVRRDKFFLQKGWKDPQKEGNNG